MSSCCIGRDIKIYFFVCANNQPNELFVQHKLLSAAIWSIML